MSSVFAQWMSVWYQSQTDLKLNLTFHAQSTLYFLNLVLELNLGCVRYLADTYVKYTVNTINYAKQMRSHTLSGV